MVLRPFNVNFLTCHFNQATSVSANFPFTGHARLSSLLALADRLGKSVKEAVCALYPVPTIDSLCCSSCPPRRPHPQPHLPPTLASKRSSKLRSNRTKSRPRKTFSHIRSPLKYNLASQLPPYLLSFKIGFENSRQTAMVMSD